MMPRWITKSMLVLTLLFSGAPVAEALPRNFRNVDTFFVGAMPDVDDLDEFKTLGISTIVSLHRLPPEVQKRAKKLGIKLYSFPLRTRLLRIDEIIPSIRFICTVSMAPIEREPSRRIGFRRNGISIRSKLWLA